MNIRQIVHAAFTNVSACTNGQGQFDAGRANKIAEQLITDLEDVLDKEISNAKAVVPAPAIPAAVVSVPGNNPGTTVPVAPAPKHLGT